MPFEIASPSGDIVLQLLETLLRVSGVQYPESLPRSDPGSLYVSVHQIMMISQSLLKTCGEEL